MTTGDGRCHRRHTVSVKDDVRRVRALCEDNTAEIRTVRGLCEENAGEIRRLRVLHEALAGDVKLLREVHGAKLDAITKALEPLAALDAFVKLVASDHEHRIQTLEKHAGAPE